MSASTQKKQTPPSNKKNAVKSNPAEKTTEKPVPEVAKASVSDSPVVQSTNGSKSISEYFTVMNADERNAIAKRWEECVELEFQSSDNIREESERDHFYRVIAGIFTPALSGSAADFEMRFSFFMQQFNYYDENLIQFEEQFKSMDKKDPNRVKVAEGLEKLKKDYESFRKRVLEFFQTVVSGAEVFIYAGLGMFTILREWHDRVAKTPAEKKFAFDVYKVMKSTIFIGVLTFLDGANDENWGKTINVMAPYTIGKIAQRRRLKVEDVGISDIVNCLQLAAYAQLQCERVESIAHMLTPLKLKDEASASGPSSGNKKKSAKEESAEKRDQRYMNESQSLINSMKRMFSPYTRTDERTEEIVRVSSVASTALFGQCLDVVARINTLYVQTLDKAKKDGVSQEELNKLSAFDFTEGVVASLLDEWIRVSSAWKKAVSKKVTDTDGDDDNDDKEADDEADDDEDEDEDYEKIPEAEPIPDQNIEAAIASDAVDGHVEDNELKVSVKNAV